ncbi:hypothetical protein BDV18DRAFT_148921 [Aspergillus unguis]
MTLPGNGSRCLSYEPHGRASRLRSTTANRFFVENVQHTEVEPELQKGFAHFLIRSRYRSAKRLYQPRPTDIVLPFPFIRSQIQRTMALDKVISTINTYKNRPAQDFYRGKPLVSTFEDTESSEDWPGRMNAKVAS